MKSPTLKKLRDVSELDAWRAKLQAAAGATGADAAPRQILICFGGSCLASGAKEVRDALAAVLKREGLAEQVALVGTGCMGPCVIGPVLMITEDRTFYQGVKPEDAEEIVTEHLKAGRRVERLLVSDPSGQTPAPCRESIEFFKRQTQIVLRNCGWVDPGRIEDTIARDGYAALAKILSGMKPDEVIAEMKASGLRGRGGAGFPTWLKWHLATQTPEGERYVLCNADEGDPGAFMDRSMLESDPFNAIEGMIIGGFAVGAQRGFIYIRAEYPLAIRRIQHAMELCHKYGILGENIMNSGFAFDIEIRLGAGAFVCGEETALIRSIEGERGQPRIRPPYPSQSGLWGKPTVINNAETFANIAAIINYGGEWFNRLGTEKSGGTKVFALAGKVRHTGLVEVPLGTTLREIVYDIGGGVPKDKKLKAIQTGGPAGGCIPAKWADLAVDFDTLTQAGSIMGSGGMIVLDEDDCMVDIAKFYLSFSQDESCGKCTPCREGTTRILEILEKITGGDGTVEDLDRLERLAKLVNRSSLCGLGRAAPNPVLSTLKHFRAEYLAHVVDKRCPSKRCKALLHYEIDAEKCIGCTVCARNCPAECIAGARKTAHVIDAAKCVKCGRCFEVCRFDAVIRT